MLKKNCSMYIKIIQNLKLVIVTEQIFLNLIKYIFVYYLYGMFLFFYNKENNVTQRSIYQIRSQKNINWEVRVHFRFSMHFSHLSGFSLKSGKLMCAPSSYHFQNLFVLPLFILEI